MVIMILISSILGLVGVVLCTCKLVSSLPRDIYMYLIANNLCILHEVLYMAYSQYVYVPP